MSEEKTLHVWECLELSFEASKKYNNPFKDIHLKVEFFSPDNQKIVIHGFWDGENIWKVRFAPTTPGEWTWKSYCSNIEDNGLHNKKGCINVINWSDTDIKNNPLRKGFIRIHDSGRYFTYADGTPFYWLGDTLWFLYTERCDINYFLPKYINDRKNKGFTVIQIVIGRPGGAEAENRDPKLFKHWFSNEAGEPYIKKYDLINPDYFKKIDAKIKVLLDAGLLPCIMGMWGWDIRMGLENAKEYWRYIISRYAAYNIIWSVAGEYYFVPDKEAWREIGIEIHNFDPYKHPTSAHSTAPHSGSRHYQNDDWYDFNLIQVGHVLAFRQCIEFLPYIDYNSYPIKPVIMCESWYESHPNCVGNEKRRIIDKDIRFAAYVSLLQGCIGQTYGAHGIWNLYTDDDYSLWDDYNRPNPWWIDLNAPGSKQMSYLKNLMSNLKWWLFEPHPELVTTPTFMHSYCSAIPGQEYLVYVTGGKGELIVFVLGDENINYKGQWFNPITGEWSNAEGEYMPYGSWWRWTTVTPDDNDWVLLLKRNDV